MKYWYFYYLAGMLWTEIYSCWTSDTTNEEELLQCTDRSNRFIL